MGNLELDVSTIEPNSFDNSPLTPGRYRAKVIESTVMEAKSGKGTLLKLTHEITGPSSQGRRLWTNLNLTHESEKAQQIGRGQISSLCRACGKLGWVDDSTELHEIEHEIAVKTQEAKDGYEARSVITAFYPIQKAASATEDIADFMK